MKKNMKKLFSTLLAAALVVGGVSVAPAVANAEEESYPLFIAYGGDKEASGDWGLGFASADQEGATTIKVGETVTTTLTFDAPNVYTWYMAPVLLAENVTEMDVTVSLKIDGEEVAIDATAGDAWWYEGTGDYANTQSIRLYGGYNEWGAHYVESPVGATTIEYTVTLNSITTGVAEVGAEVESTETYDMFLAIGADHEAGDWAYSYAGGDAPEGAVVTCATIKSGETATVSIEWPEASAYTWYCAPTIVATGVTTADFTVKVYVDDVEVAVDATAGDNWWYEGTGDYAADQTIRVYGGYNEWGTHYIESPVNYTKLTFEVTANVIMVGGAVEEEEFVSAAGDVDVNGKYNAYIGFQTPKYSFRNAFDEASYGKDVEDGKYFYQVTGWDAENNAVTLPGTFADVEIAGNGTYTVSVDGLEFPDGEFADQDYMNLIFLSTDIPNTGVITISDIVLKVNGSKTDLAADGAKLQEDVDYMNVQLQNIWDNDIKTIGYYQTPVKNMSITFTVSGFAYDKAADEEAAPVESAPATGDTATTEPAPVEKNNKVPVWPFIVCGVVIVGGICAGVVISKKKQK